jgi:hypothetical protein
MSFQNKSTFELVFRAMRLLREAVRDHANEIAGRDPITTVSSQQELHLREFMHERFVPLYEEFQKTKWGYDHDR